MDAVLPQPTPNTTKGLPEGRDSATVVYEAGNNLLIAFAGTR